MLYEVFTRIISDMCLRIGTPLTVKRISFLLCNLIDEDLVDALCRRMLNEGILVRCTEDALTTRTMAKISVVNSLITEEYQQLGMTMMQVNERSWVRYIPPTSEHRFFELKPSSISADAGLGLYVRTTRRIPQGCVLCEYRGRLLKVLPKNIENGTYVVRVRDTACYLDGVTEDGSQHLSLATFINDNGPLKANAAMMEYSGHPGRVFLVANRDIQPGEEIFVVYGAKYWGFTSYAELREKAKKRSKRSRDLVEDDAIAWRDLIMPCRRCGDNIVRRSLRLHSEYCGDPLVKKKLLHLDCLPFHDFTAADVSCKVLYERRNKTLQRAKSFVKLSEPQTFSHTHEDAVGDLEFTFKESV
ncbi:unnamed protein product [Phytomonas sp. EM1]|nr:unnamed protein product [Phytomonas sp. EM1]|eukprot:CCW63200.1 unnamed protein product [Phytomonas sp. isolate EM1]